jgi:hypothetical protein
MRDDKWGVLIFLALTFAIEYAIVKKTSRTEVKYSKMFYECVYLIVSYWTAYMCFGINR